MAETLNPHEQFANWKAPDTTETKAAGIKPVDIKTLGQSKETTAKHGNIRSEKNEITVGDKVYPENGKVFQDGKEADSYQYEYVKLPSGDIRFSKCTDKLSDGKEEVFDRKFNERGQITETENKVNGVVRQKESFKYNKDGVATERVFQQFDEKGKETRKVVEEIKDGERMNEFSSKETLADGTIQEKKALAHKGLGIDAYITGPQSVLEVTAGIHRNYEEGRKK